LGWSNGGIEKEGGGSDEVGAKVKWKWKKKLRERERERENKRRGAGGGKLTPSWS